MRSTTRGPESRIATAGTTRAVVALLALLTTALLACGDDDHGSGPPTPTPSATPVPTTTPQPTATPDPGTFSIADDLPSTSAVAAAFGGGRYLVTWSAPTERSAPDVVGARLDPDGAVLDSPPLLLSALGDEPFLGPGGDYVPGGIAFGASGFGAFFYGSAITPSGPPGQIVGFAGVPVEGPPALPATTIDEQQSFSMAQTALVPPVAATSNGTLFLGLYQRVLTVVGGPSASQVVGQIVTAAPRVEAQEIGPFSGPPVREGLITSGSAPGVATRDDGAALAAWVEGFAPESMPSEVSYRLQSVVLTESEASPVTLVAELAESSHGGFVASDGTSFLVVWSTAPASAPDVRSELRAIRYTPGSEPAPAGGFVVAGGAAAKSVADVVFAAGEYLIAWVEDGALNGARVGTTGDDVELLELDPGPVADAALATDGTQVLVVVDREDEGGTSDVLGRFVTLD